MFHARSLLALVSGLALLTFPTPPASRGASRQDEVKAAWKEGSALREKGDLHGAEERIREGLRIAKASDLRRNAYYALLQNELGKVYSARGDPDRAIATFEKSIKTFARVGDASARASIIAVRQNLGLAHRQKWDFDKAEACYKACLSDLRKMRGGLARSIPVRIDLAILYVFERRDADAERILSTVLKELAGTADKDLRLQRAYAFKNRGQLYFAGEQYEAAKADYEAALQLLEEYPQDQLPPDRLRDRAGCYSNLGWLCVQQGRPDEARRHFDRSLKVFEQARARPVQLATVRRGLAQVHYGRGDYPQARSLLQQVLDDQERERVKNDPDIAKTLFQLARVCAAEGDVPRAGSYVHRARQIQRRNITRILPFLPEHSHQAFLRRANSSYLDTALSLACLKPTRAGLAERSAEWLINAKGEIQEALTCSLNFQENLFRGKSPPEVKRFLRLRKEIAPLGERLFLDKAAGDTDPRVVELQTLEAELRKTWGRRWDGERWISLADVRKRLAALSPKACYIDVARLRPTEFPPPPGKPEFGAAQYVAWVVRPTGRVEMVRLGDAKKIDAAVRSIVDALAGSKAYDLMVSDDGGPSVAYKKLLEKQLKQLSATVLHRLLAKVASTGECDRLVISPDGALWLLPWHALLLKDGETFAVEKYVFQYVVSGRDLFSTHVPPNVKRKGKSPVSLILADPDYGKAPANPAVEFKRLRDTRREAKAAFLALRRADGRRPKLLRGPDATKKAVQNARGVPVLYLATHGFFAPRNGGNSHPLDRCGLPFAGAYRSWAKGVLSGREAAALDLRGTRLVVLSACQTGIGDEEAGEQVRGLRQAFQLAGARAVVSTLWEVPSEYSADLMESFLKQRLARGADLAVNLCQAQRQLIAAQRKLARGGADPSKKHERESPPHPFLWAGYTLTGL
jgi:CHAT domain-containing protein/tetratricopeptide (TPR) repeat protein